VNVVEGPVVFRFGKLGRVGVEAKIKFLERRDVNNPVVKKIKDLRQIFHQ